MLILYTLPVVKQVVRQIKVHKMVHYMLFDIALSQKRLAYFQNYFLKIGYAFLLSCSLLLTAYNLG